jgi:hypothetical protein
MATGGGGGAYSGDSDLAGAEGEAARIGRTGGDQGMEWTGADADLAGGSAAAVAAGGNPTATGIREDMDLDRQDIDG